MQTITASELKKYLSEILSCNAFELHTDDKNAYIPYMMNDALECYLQFSDARLTGKYLPDSEAETSFELIREENRQGLIFRQETENVFTLWFSHCCRILQCYRYDRIGHFWVSGQEHWRRLVYIIGTIYDKYEYLGKQVCTPQELELLPLMEFAPFRMYSPIHTAAEASADPLNTTYPDTLGGYEAIKALAVQANDHLLLMQLALYRRFPFSWMKKSLHRSLNRPARIPLYELLFYKISEAASVYPERNYDDLRSAQIRSLRIQAENHLHKEGFSGQYPFFQKGCQQVLAMEEHPFTILEASDFDFRIHLMESETTRSSSHLNAGFFKQKGNRSRISRFPC